MKKAAFLSLDQVLEIHRMQLQEFGMAAAYAFHIAENQPFVDGNKRTGLNCALTFLKLNGILIKCPGNELFQAMIDVGNRRLSKEGLSRLLENWAHR